MKKQQEAIAAVVENTADAQSRAANRKSCGGCVVSGVRRFAFYGFRLAALSALAVAVWLIVLFWQDRIGAPLYETISQILAAGAPPNFLSGVCYRLGGSVEWYGYCMLAAFAFIRAARIAEVGWEADRAEQAQMGHARARGGTQRV